MTQRRIYQDEFPYFVTFRMKEGFRLFEEEKYAELLARIIFKTCKIKKYDCLAFQVMPDHVHILIFNQYHRARAAVPARHFLEGRAPTAGVRLGEFKLNWRGGFDIIFYNC